MPWGVGGGECSGESTCLLPKWPGFDSWTDSNITCGLSFLVPVLTPRWFFLGTLLFTSPQNPIFLRVSEGDLFIFEFMHGSTPTARPPPPPPPLPPWSIPRKSACAAWRWGIFSRCLLLGYLRTGTTSHEKTYGIKNGIKPYCTMQSFQGILGLPTWQQFFNMMLGCLMGYWLLISKDKLKCVDF